MKIRMEKKTDCHLSIQILFVHIVVYILFYRFLRGNINKY